MRNFTRCVILKSEELDGETSPEPFSSQKKMGKVTRIFIHDSKKGQDFHRTGSFIFIKSKKQSKKV